MTSAAVVAASYSNMKTTNFLFSIIALMALAISPASAQSRPKVVAYLPNWIDLEEFSKTIDYTKVTHLNLAFENPVDDTGKLSFNKQNEIILKQAKAAGVKVLVSIGGGSASGNKELKARYFKLLGKEHRSALAKSLADYVSHHGFDGLDVDIEGPSINEDYGNFIEALGHEFKPRNKLLTAALSKGYGGDRVPDAALAHFDFLNIMAYDATGTWDRERAGQHSSFEFAKAQVAYWVDRGLPKSKAILGIPFYGYGFGDSWRNYSFPFSEIVNDNPDAARTDETRSTIYYNGIPTISKKARYVLDEKLGGGS